MMLQPYSGYFGTELEIGVNLNHFSEAFLKIDNQKVNLSDDKPIIFVDISELEYKETSANAKIKLEFSELLSSLVAPIYSKENILQGMRLFFFKQIDFPLTETMELSIKVVLSRSIV